MCRFKLVAYLAHKRLYKGRCKENLGLKYFSHTNFEGIIREELEFKNHFNETIRGGIYYKENYKTDNICIFVHGNGSAHNAYIKEISFLADAGFKVLAYDVTATNESEGKNLRGFYQHPSDLHALLSHLKTSEYKDLPIYLIGHSWGGYTVLNALNFDNNQNIKKIISLSGLRSTKETFLEHSPEKYREGVKYLLRKEEKIYGKDIHFDAKDYLGSTDIDVLLIHSKDDPVLNYDIHFVPMMEAGKDNKHVYTLILDGHLHNPTYLVESAQKLRKYFMRLIKLKKQKEIIALKNSTDFDELSSLDEKIMYKIINFLNN